MVDIIFYGYEMAPNPQKLLQFLAFFKIPYSFVEIPVMLPRPDLESVGINYRRSPLLSIESDMYVDTSLIITKLCDMAAHSDNDVDATNHIEFFDLGEQIFKLATALIPLDHPVAQNEALLKDRSELHGRPFDIKEMVKARPLLLSKMKAYVSLIQKNFLKDGKKFFLGGTVPSTADLYVYWSLNWGLQFHHGTRPEISEKTYPIIFTWLASVSDFLAFRAQRSTLSFDDARTVLLRPPKHEYVKFVPHDDDNPLGLHSDDQVSVTPEDSGRSHPQKGKLVCLNDDQMCIRNEKGLVMHFPRLGYSIQKV